MHEYFYVGGKYVETDGGHLKCGQMYVEKYTPDVIKHKYPLVFFSGTAQTATNWMTKPDGNPGWIQYFVQCGYEVYVVDQPARGRSNFCEKVDGEYAYFSTEVAELLFTKIEARGNWEQAKLHTQWPGEGVKGDPIFDTFYDTQVGFLASNEKTELLIQEAGAALLDKIGAAILVTHSQAGAFGWVIADVRPELVKGIVALEPLGPPRENAVLNTQRARKWGLTDIPMTYSPSVSNSEEIKWKRVESEIPEYVDGWLQAEPALQLVNLKGIPIVIITTEASYHVQYDIWTSRFLTQAGVKNDFIELAKIGIKGNGHMLMLEKNSDEIAALVEKWICKNC